MTKIDEKNVVRKRLAKALTQLAKEKKKFRECLDAETMEDALNRCLFSRNFPPVGKAWEVDEVMISSLEQWWRAITGKTGKPQMDDEAYDSLAARFCGPATSLHVQTAHQSRADVYNIPLFTKNEKKFPTPVLRELETGPAYSTRAMYPYATMDTGILSSVPPPTDGPPVKRIIHAGPGHTADSIIGLERPVVVLIGTNDMNATVPQYVDPWCDVIARCLSQLVIVSGPASAVEDWGGDGKSEAALSKTLRGG
nr:hypothetical protein BaRGS_007271 [Batillaria attramentaria]